MTSNALAINGQFFHEIVSSAPVAIVAWDLNFITTEWNQQAEAVFGWTRSEMIGARLLDTLLVIDKAPVAELLERLRGAQAPVRNINDNRTKDGRQITCEWTNTPTRDGIGRVNGAIGVAIDITERLRIRRDMEDRLRFETLVATASQRLVSAAPEQAGAEVTSLMQQIGGFFDVDRVSLGRISADQMRLTVVTSWSRTGAPLRGEIPANQAFPWTFAEIRSGRVVQFSTPDELPPEAAVDRRTYASMGTQAALMMPLVGIAGSPDYAIALGHARSNRQWDEVLQSRVRLVGEVIANAVTRNDAQLAQRASEDRLQFALAASNTAVWDLDYETGEAYFSPQVFSILGYEQNAFPSTQENWAKLTHPDDLTALSQLVEESVRSGKPSYETTFRMRAKSGEWRWLLGRGIITRSSEGKALRITGTNTDITERKQAEERLLMVARGVSSSTGHPFLRSLVEHLATSLNADYCFVGELIEDTQRVRAIASFGINDLSFEYDLSGTPCSNVVGGGGGPCVYPSAVQTLFPADQILQTMRIEAYIGTPLVDSSGNPLGILVVLSRHPITRADIAQSLLQIFASRAAAELERHRAERSLRESDQRLRHALAAAEAAGRAKDHFLAILSHELRTPLTPVLATAGMLESDPRLPDDVRDDAGTMRRNIETEAHLIDDLLDLTRIAQGKIRLHFEAVNSHAVLQAALSISTSEAAAKRLRISAHLEAQTPHVWADAGRVQQVFLNILQNAVKFTPEGGSITVTTSNHEGRWRLEVTDTGIGIAADRLPYIFSAFEQGERTITRKFGGLGLGLSIAKSIVDLHGGSIDARSEGPDRGATFRVELPTVSGVPKPSSVPSQREAPGSRLILLVEDHPDTMRVLSRALRSLGYKVHTAGGVNEAISEAQRNRPDLLLSDIGLPDGSGLDIMQQLKPWKVPGIAVSGFGMEEDVRKALDAGFNDYLTKPLDMRKLQSAIARTLESSPAA